MKFKVYRNGNYVGTYPGASSDVVINGLVKTMQRACAADRAKPLSKLIAEYSAEKAQ